MLCAYKRKSYYSGVNLKLSNVQRVIQKKMSKNDETDIQMLRIQKIWQHARVGLRLEFPGKMRAVDVDELKKYL